MVTLPLVESLSEEKKDQLKTILWENNLTATEPADLTDKELQHYLSTFQEILTALN